MRERVLADRILDDGRELVLYPMAFDNTRLCIGEAGAGTYDDAYCYQDLLAACKALETWNGEGDPDGWVRHIGSGRRRPDGDPAKEYVCP